jgi:hypothetical protein
VSRFQLSAQSRRALRLGGEILPQYLPQRTIQTKAIIYLTNHPVRRIVATVVANEAATHWPIRVACPRPQVLTVLVNATKSGGKPP